MAAPFVVDGSADAHPYPETYNVNAIVLRREQGSSRPVAAAMRWCDPLDEEE
jgi:hypothetical protein